MKFLKRLGCSFFIADCADFKWMAQNLDLLDCKGLVGVRRTKGFEKVTKGAGDPGSSPG